MRKNIIANGINIVFSIAFLVTVFLLQLNPLSLITAFIVTVTNMLLALYSMGIQTHPKVKIGPITGSVYLFNIATFIMQALLIVAALSSSLWVTILCMFAVLVYLECISLFLKEVFRAMRFHIAVTFSVSYVTLILYCILRAYRDYAFQVPTTLLALGCLAIYAYLMYKEKDFFKMTAYSAVFSEAVVLLALGSYASQNIYGAILCLVGLAPVMFLLLLAGYSIQEAYETAGSKEISSVLLHFRVAGVGYIVGLLAILGFPPFSLFFGRLLILQSAVTAGSILPIAMLVIVFVLSSYFLLYNVLPKLFGGRKEELLTVKSKRFNNVLIMILLIFVIVLTVLIPGFIEALVSDARAYVMGVL